MKLTWKCQVADAKEVNFLEKPVGTVHIDGESFTVSVKPYGIHTVKVRLLPGVEHEMGLRSNRGIEAEDP